MKRSLKQTLTLLGCIGVSVTANFLPLAQPATADTTARLQGRCKLTNLTPNQAQGYNPTPFDGYCTVKQKQGGSTTVLVVELDNGLQYRFFGPTIQALQVETDDGIHNVSYTESSGKEVFTWDADGDRNRLSVKLDTQYAPDVSHDDPAPSLGTALGEAFGAVIGGLISGKKPTQLPSTPTASSQPAAGTTVSALSDLVGARAGQAENAITQRGYRFVKASPSGDAAYSYWLEAGTSYCVVIRTANGRYASIAYTGGSADCQQ